jgi:hypothetical protein
MILPPLVFLALANRCDRKLTSQTLHPGLKGTGNGLVTGNTADFEIREQCYNTFSVRNLRIFVVSKSVCPWRASTA